MAALMHVLSSSIAPPQVAQPPLPFLPPPPTAQAVALAQEKLLLPVDNTKILLRNLSMQSSLLNTLTLEMQQDEKLVNSLKAQTRAKELESSKLKASLTDLEEKLKAERAKFEEAEAIWIEKESVWKAAASRLESKKVSVQDLERVVSELKEDVRRETGFDPEKLVSSSATTSQPTSTDISNGTEDCESINGANHAKSSSSAPRIQIVERGASGAARLSSPTSPVAPSTSMRSGSDLRNILDSTERKRSIHGPNDDRSSSSSSLITAASSSGSSSDKGGVAITIVERRRGTSPSGNTSTSDRITTASTSSSSNNTSGASQYCVPFNQQRCSHSSSSCHNIHGCLFCHSTSHPLATCPAQRNICVTWNMSSPSTSCPSSCRREHQCLRCANTHHKLISCPHPVEQGLEFCFAFNAWGVCRFHQTGECARAHFCMRCMSEDHAGFKCPLNMSEYASNSDSAVSGNSSSSSSSTTTSSSNKRRGEDSHYSDYDSKYDSKRGRYEGSGSAASSSSSSRNKSPPPRSSSSSSMPPPRTSSSSSTSGVRILVEERKSSSSSSSNNNNNSNSSTNNSNNNNSNSSSSSSVASVGGMVGVERSTGSHSPPTSSSTRIFSLLTNSERGMICRDYNNGKCGLEKTSCRFKHICLRCGDPSHQEKRCPHSAP
ncbi:hypothetical protein BDR26DRAFT_863337 [Obelidium mucronatum]|nr:hypothetical protein BDR26DRAFT_863337 [Obelidium mucronatum]